MTTLIADEEKVEVIEVTEPRQATTEKPKLTRLMELVGSIPKDKQNDFHHYKYQSAEAVLDKVRSGLIELGMYSIPTFFISGVEGDLVTMGLTLRVFDETGLLAESTTFGSGSDKGDKASMKGQTAAIKYGWKMLLNISTGDDPEADTATDARVAPNVSAPESKGITGALGRVTQAKVLEVKKKSASDKSPYLVVTDKGEYQTFDKDVISQMGLAQATGLLVEFPYKTTNWGKDIVKEKPATE